MSTKTFTQNGSFVRRARVWVLSVLIVAAAGFLAAKLYSGKTMEARIIALQAQVDAFPSALEASERRGKEAGYLDSSWDTYFKRNRYAFQTEDDGKIVAWKMQELPPDKVAPVAKNNFDTVPLVQPTDAASAAVPEQEKKTSKR